MFAVAIHSSQYGNTRQNVKHSVLATVHGVAMEGQDGRQRLYDRGIPSREELLSEIGSQTNSSVASSILAGRRIGPLAFSGFVPVSVWRYHDAVCRASAGTTATRLARRDRHLRKA